MKHFKILSTLLLCCLLMVMSSCKEDEEPINSNDNGDVFLTCKIDGTTFEAEPLTVGGTSTGNNLSVQGNGSGLNAAAITLTLNSSYDGLGTYSLGADFLFNTAIYLPSAIDPANAFGAAFGGNNVGQIEVTLDDGTYVEGTFSFECANQNDQTQTATISEGKFRMKIP